MIVLQIDKPIPIPLWESTEPVLWQMPLKISGITSGFRPCPKSLTQKCNDQHSDKYDRIAAQCEIQSEKRIGKEEIDTDYGENRRKEPVQVSVRISCNQDLGNNIK